MDYCNMYHCDLAVCVSYATLMCSFVFLVVSCLRWCVCVLYLLFGVILSVFVFVFSSRRRHTSGALVTGVQTCALPISFAALAIGVMTIWLIWRSDARGLTGRVTRAIAEVIVVGAIAFVPPLLLVLSLDDSALLEVTGALTGCAVYAAQIGRASGREGVGQYGCISGGAASEKKKR